MSVIVAAGRPGELQSRVAARLRAGLVAGFAVHEVVVPSIGEPPPTDLPRTAGLVDAAALVLTLVRSTRSGVAVLSPASRPRLFTVRQAAALAEVVAACLADGTLPPGAPLPPPREDTAARFGWYVGELDAARGRTPWPAERPGQATADDLDESSRSARRQAARQGDAAADVLVRTWGLVQAL